MHVTSDAIAAPSEPRHELMKEPLKRVLFVLFFVSGFCGLVYQVVWLRLAYASFGIITPVLSVVISVFMAGLAVGSWAGGRWIVPLTRRGIRSAIFCYAFAELMIGVGAVVLPRLFLVGAQALSLSGESDSYSYLFFSAVAIAISVFPWCFFMGTTFPFMLAFVKEMDRGEEKGFSFLYLANVLGAMTGTLVSAVVLIELLGFRHTLWVAGFLNLSIAAASVVIGGQARGERMPLQELEAPRPVAGAGGNRWMEVILFTTGFVSLAMEVVWTRAFTPVLHTQVYAFALLLFVYLLATWIGSALYRSGLRRQRVLPVAKLLALLAVTAFLPIVLNDPQLLLALLSPFSSQKGAGFALGSLVPFCAALGYLTPQLIDTYSDGDARSAGRAYALNIVGCILGPLFASYVLLPWLGAERSLTLLAAPFVLFFLLSSKRLGVAWRTVTAVVSISFLGSSIFFHTSYEDPQGRNNPSYVVRRDYAATVTSLGRGMGKVLLVNGIGITQLTPITKFMAHLPLAVHRGKPDSALVICFGMGTTYRSLMSWGIHVTAVELVPSVRDAFGYYFDDANQILDDPMGRVVIDDGRRFLRRTRQSFDVITIDPPPPPEAAGSSLLYSQEFYTDVRRRLAPGGILQQWFPAFDEQTVCAVARSLTASFRHVRVFVSIEDWGFHFLASDSPIELPSAAEAAARLPARAKTDLLEWAQGEDAGAYFGRVFSKELLLGLILSTDPRARITDDQPYNEYYLLRRWEAQIRGPKRPRSAG